MTKRKLSIGLALAATAAFFMASTSPSVPRKPMFAYYYLWWSTQHWHDKLGPNYPYTQTPLPMPATLDSSGCNPKSLYTGNTLIDVPVVLWTQDNPVLVEQDVRQAAAAGLSGFLANWAGTGSATQTVTSVSYSRRLDSLFQAVRKVNAEGIPFKIWISYKVAGTLPSPTAINNDLAYLVRQYGRDTAYDLTYGKPVLVWTGSRKYTKDQIKTVSDAHRKDFLLIGDEKLSGWNDGRSAYLDGDSYYWSSQNPYTNTGSFNTLKTLAATVHSQGKLWFAPLAPGYDSQLIGGTTCVPRNGTETLHRLYDGNLGSSPDAWTLISWNEIAENTYVVPMQRYGSLYTDELHVLGS